MFAVHLEYPTTADEIQVVKQTTTETQPKPNVVFDSTSVLAFQHLIRKIPVADNVIEYAVNIISKSRPNTPSASTLVKNYVAWGAGPRASQNLILAAKTNAVLNRKFTPDSEDVQAVAKSVLRHRIIKNYKADAEGISIDSIIDNLL